MSAYGAVLIDGAAFNNALAWLYQNYPSHQPHPLLAATPYQALKAVGPILIDAPTGSALQRDWFAGAGHMRDAVWMEAEVPIKQLSAALQRRLRIFSPDRREFWLRLADARPLRHAWKAGAQWPEGFWHGISSVWLHGNGPAQAWFNKDSKLDCAPRKQGLKAQLTLDWPLLEALTQDVTPENVTP